MKKVTVLFFISLITKTTFAQELDTLNQVSTEADGVSWLLVIFIVSIIGWIIIKIIEKVNKANKAKIAKLEQERKELLKDFLKDKSTPYFKIKGITFYEPKKPGCYIAELQPEKNNPHDPYAIAIIHSKVGMIGHLPKGNKYLHTKLQSQKILGIAEIKPWGEREQKGKFWLDPAYYDDGELLEMEGIMIKD